MDIEIIKFIEEVGFPIFISLIFILRVDVKLNKLLELERRILIILERNKK